MKKKKDKPKSKPNVIFSVHKDTESNITVIETVLSFYFIFFTLDFNFSAQCRICTTAKVEKRQAQKKKQKEKEEEEKVDFI